jgi:RNA polymerase sigma-70 factor (ECF subfamily)
MSWPITQTLAHSQSNHDDETLAARGVGDPAAFAELYQRHFQRVYRYHMTRLGSDAEAQDLTSQTFLAALEGLASYRGTGSFGAWLFGIARNKIAQYFRLQRFETPLEAAEVVPDPTPSIEAITGQRLQFASLSRTLRNLTVERAEAIELCIFADLTAREAGLVMGKSEAAVKMLLMRGLNDLKGRLAFLAEEK